MKPVRLAWILPLLAASVVLGKAAGNGPYVVTMQETGPFYARCLPEDQASSKGVTQILRVRKEGDQEVVKFDWYNRNGIVLGWSPSAGKVGVMRIRQDTYLPPEKQIEFSFYLGEQLVRSYTTADLVKLGGTLLPDLMAREFAELAPDAVAGAKRVEYQVEGVFQVWNTNDYYYRVKLDETHTLNFDIVTGKLCRVEKLERAERMTLIDQEPAK